MFDLRVKDCSRLAIANRLNMSISTVDRRLKSVKRKIDRVIEHSMTVFLTGKRQEIDSFLSLFYAKI